MPIFLTPGLWRRIGAVLDRLSDSNLDLQPRAVDEACQTEGIDTLTLQIGSSCSAIPDAEKTRVYEASIGQIANRKDLGDVVTLTGAHFLTGPICTLASGRFASIGCSQFFASEDLDWVGFFLQNNNDPSARRAYRRTDVVRRLARDHRPCTRVRSTTRRRSTQAAWLTFGCARPRQINPCPEYRVCPSTDLHLRLDRK
jgi:hypothetical protein